MQNKSLLFCGCRREKPLPFARKDWMHSFLRYDPFRCRNHWNGFYFNV